MIQILTSKLLEIFLITSDNDNNWTTDRIRSCSILDYDLMELGMYDLITNLSQKNKDALLEGLRECNNDYYISLENVLYENLHTYLIEAVKNGVLIEFVKN